MKKANFYLKIIDGIMSKVRIYHPFKQSKSLHATPNVFVVVKKNTKTVMTDIVKSKPKN